MKKTKKFLSAFLALMMVISIIPMASITVSAANNIVINGVDIGYAVGSYFTKNGKSCANSYWSNGKCHDHGICVDSTHSQCNCMRYWPTGQKSTCQVDLLSSQCMGFARYCQWKVYGYHDGQTKSKFTNLCAISSSSCTADTLKTKLLNCAPGTHIRTGNDGHSQSIISTTSSGVTVAECNVDGYCGVRTKYYSWADYASYFKSRGGVKYAYSFSANTGGTTSCDCSSSYAGNYVCTTTSTNLYIRSGHGTSYSAIGSIPSGTTVYVSKANGSWAHVTYNGVSGYASMSYLTKQTTQKPTLSLSTNVVNLTLGGTESATVVIDIINDNGNCDIEVDGNNSNCYNRLWQAWQDGEEYFECDIDAKATGTTIFTVKLIDLSNNTVIESKNITAYVSAKTYTISYNANGGTGAPASQTKTHGTALTLSNTIPTRTGYTFLGWSTSSTATTATYSAGANFTTNASTTLYAVWREDVKRESVVKLWVSSHPYVTSQSVFPVGKEYLFGYQIYDENTGEHYNSYTDNNYTVQITIYDPSGNIVLINSTNNDDNHFVRKVVEEIGIYRFVVSITGDISGEYTKTIEVVNSTYTISYSANGGTGAPASQTKAYGTALTLSSTIPTRTGYTFLGWSTSSTATSATYSAGDNFTTNANTTLYAVWQKNAVAPETPEYNYTFSIQEPSRTEIRNKDGIILHTNIEGTAPAGLYVVWTSNNSNFDEDADGNDLTVIAKNKGWTTFTATLYDADGNVLATDSVELYSKSGFFDKIGGFFRSLFGSTKIYEN